MKYNQQGNKNPHWKGGKTLSSKGYVLIRAPEHPRSSNGYVFEHILILEAKLGRPLLPWEDSHHINGIKTDNKPENLEVKIHNSHTILHWLGKHHSPESIKKMQESKIGKQMSLACKEKHRQDILIRQRNELGRVI